MTVNLVAKGTEFNQMQLPSVLCFDYVCLPGSTCHCFVIYMKLGLHGLLVTPETVSQPSKAALHSMPHAEVFLITYNSKTTGSLCRFCEMLGVFSIS